MDTSVFGLLNQKLRQIMRRNKIFAPTKVQTETIPRILNGEDVIVRARTGSGKTLAYALPILNKFTEPSMVQKIDLNSIQVLILLPTKELCNQVTDVFRAFCENSVRVRSFTPKSNCGRIFTPKDLECVILITTPKSLLTMEAHLAPMFRNVNTIVFDEADKLVEGEGEDINEKGIVLHQPV
eukprot:MONOS_220.1-p1 / transcript=MONOS_220.1 / gene=MONOS_220 / organism=Monocercomonoides_exilis_PA203 / gene_product=RNA helicase / transcript_product=RNA helicase / location=Mono_scaffold00003:316763-317511(-) / protein_length=182 / sequence_SO=supercontig / SO=protein_coding / is_pseudo=false